MNQYMPQENTLNREQVSAEAAKAFVTQVFGYMFLALVISATMAYAFSTSSLINHIFDPFTHKPTPLFYISVFSPIAIVLLLGYGLEKLSLAAVIGLFVAYASFIGISLSTIFLVYDPMMIVKAFAVTAGTFGIMAVVGYTTKADLSKFGMLMMFALIGAMLAFVLNFFIKSDGLSLIVDIVFIIVFTGLIGWKMQMVRQMGEQFGTTQPKMAVWMGLQLYVTFINLFLTILRFMRR
ncbi:Bax inhibitor-1/YccA family protein [soil metagenome]